MGNLKHEPVEKQDGSISGVQLEYSIECENETRRLTIGIVCNGSTRGQIWGSRMPILKLEVKMTIWSVDLRGNKVDHTYIRYVQDEVELRG